MQYHLSGLSALYASFGDHRKLIASLSRREAGSRYRGSLLGKFWLVIQPASTLLVYTLVFSTIFKTRWPGGTDSKAEFALVLFVGLLVFNFFSETIGRAPILIVQNPSYVKKVIFPLEALSWVNILTGAFHLAISTAIWLLFYVLVFKKLHATVLLFPIVIAPLILTQLGISWMLSSLGVYLRDVPQVVNLLVTLLLFLSPIFFPVAALPPYIQPLMNLNPLTLIIEESRNVLMWGELPNFSHLLVHWGVSFFFAWAGFAWFQKTRKGFADVL